MYKLTTQAVDLVLGKGDIDFNAGGGIGDTGSPVFKYFAFITKKFNRLNAQ